MRNYHSFARRLIKLTKEYPIYNSDINHNDEVIGYTKVGDLAVITYANEKENYFEMLLVSGEFIGVDTLALDMDDILSSTFIFNKVEGETKTTVLDKEIHYEYI